MRATIWKVPSNREDAVKYRLQVDGIFGKREENNIVKVLKDWSDAGYGFSKVNKKTTLIFVKSFKTKELMLEWAKSFPYELVEQTNRGNYRKIKTSFKAK
jgi:hypothetical protein